MQIKKILVPTDFSDCADAALSQALLIAYEHDAEIHLLHVVTLHGEDPNHPDSHFPEIEAIFRSFEKRASEAMAKLLADTKFGAVRVSHDSVRAIAPAPAIVEYADSRDFDLTVLGTHGRRGARRLLLGSVAEEVVRTIGSPVLTVGRKVDGKPRLFNRVMVPYDFSDHADHALSIGIEIARRYEGKVELVHVVTPPVAPAAVAGIPTPGFFGPDLSKDLGAVLESRASKAAKAEGVPVSSKVLEGHTEMLLVDYATQQDVDLIVMGSHGLTGLWRFLLGSVTEKVVRAAECPVWIVRFHPKDSEVDQSAEDLAKTG